MLRFLVVRFSLIALTLLVVSVAIFVVTEVLPGDVAWHILGQGATPENLEAVREKLDLNRPAHIRYLGWIGSALRGDLGDSYLKPTGCRSRGVEAIQLGNPGRVCFPGGGTHGGGRRRMGRSA